MSTKRIVISLIILAILLIQPTTTYSLIDLEDMSSACVISTKQIKLPEYPHAFNPSIIRWRDKLLMSFRIVPNPKRPYESLIGLVWLNDDFEPISEPQLLQLRNPTSSVPSRMEDGRLIEIQGDLYLVYSDNEDLVISRGGFRVYIAQLKDKNGVLSIRHIERLSYFEGNNEKRREKNWVPFAYNNQLMLSYSLSPHVVFAPLFNTNGCRTVSSSPKNVEWEWGELLGGTCASLDGDHYIGFFHSRIRMSSVHTPKDVSHYFMGAYTFTRTKPFTITHISKEPIIGKHFYHGAEYPPYWGTVRVIFPCGFVADENYFWITFGRQDHEMWITQIDKKMLYESLIPVEEKKKQPKK